jgi:hypothetical protein
LFDDENFESKEGIKYGKILMDLKDCYNFENEDGTKVHDGFSLYVTGHRYVWAAILYSCPSLYVVATA